MPTFTTPAPIDLAVHLPVGSLTVIATDRADAVVTVLPTNPDRPLDRRGAEETKVDFTGQRLTVKGPRPRFSIIGPSESVDVTVELPADSRLTSDNYGMVRTTGRLGATRIKASGVELEATGDLWVRALHGNVEVDTIDGTAEITADHGQIKIGTVAGDAVLKASHGSLAIGESGGDVEAKLSYGDVEIVRALASVAAKTAFGSVKVSEVSAGSITLDSGFGQVTVGVRAGIPAWLDLASKNGRVRNELDGDRAPEAASQTVTVRVRTEFGDINVKRAK
jgi:hypothetical protein